MTAANESSSPTALLLLDAATASDLGTFLTRAKRVDPDGAARLVGHGEVLAVYVSPLHSGSLMGGGVPTVIGLRTLALAAPSGADVVAPLAALTDRLARPGAGGVTVVDDGHVSLPLPPVELSGTAWAGISPPRKGWQALGMADVAALRATARDGIAEVAAGSPDGAGGHAIEQLRAAVWARPSVELAGTPAGAAFAAEALGFLVDAEPVGLYACGQWRRLTTSLGHVLVRASTG